MMQRALVEDGWPRLAAHVIFSITDCLERYAIHRLTKKIPSDTVSYSLKSRIICKISLGNTYIFRRFLRNYIFMVGYISAGRSCPCLTAGRGPSLIGNHFFGFGGGGGRGEERMILGITFFKP